MSSIPSYQLAEVCGPPGAPSVDGIYECLMQGLNKNPDSVAIISTWQDTDHLANTISSKYHHNSGDLQWTYRQLNEASLKLATYLAGRSPPNRPLRLTCLVWNSIEHAILQWAVAHLRGVFIPLDPDLLKAGREESRNWFLSSLEPDVVIPWEYNDGFERSVSAIIPNAVRITVTADSALPSHWQSLVHILTSTTISDPLGTIAHTRPADPTAPIQILFTSGTTCRPKPVAHSAAQGTPCTIAAAQAFPVGATSLMTTANFRPIYNVYTVFIYTAGTTVLIPDPIFTPDAAISAVLTYSPQQAIFVPAQLRQVVSAAAAQNLTFPCFGSVGVGGDVITSDVLEFARPTFPNATFRVTLGMTEAYTLASSTIGPNEPIPKLASNVVSIGLPYPGIILRVTGHDTFTPVKRGEKGDLWVAGQSVLDGYFDGRDPDSFHTAPDLSGRERRWFRTGDWALIDEQGHLYVLGRFKDVIKRAGVNLSPVAAEAALAKLGLEAQVVGVPHEVLGSAPVAIVRDRKDKEVGTVVEETVGLLGQEYRLEGVYTLAEVGLEDWQLNSTGKISKTDLQRTLRDSVIGESL